MSTSRRLFSHCSCLIKVVSDCEGDTKRQEMAAIYILCL